MDKTQQLHRQGRGNPLAVHPVVEIIGQSRLLIENHQGVIAYSTNEIKVKVSYGCVIVLGDKLQLMEMSRIKLVICGVIDGVQIFGR